MSDIRPKSRSRKLSVYIANGGYFKKEEEHCVPTALDEIEAIRIMANRARDMNGNLAGGCIRELILGNYKKIKDYDIFVFNDKPPALNPDVFGWSYDINVDNWSQIRREVKGIQKYRKVSLDVVIVDCADIRETVATFDSSICQVWIETVDGVHYIMCSDAFMDYLFNNKWYYYVDTLAAGHVWRMVKKYGPFEARYKPREMGVNCLCKLSDVKDTFPF